MTNGDDYSEQILIDDWNPVGKVERISLSQRTYNCLLPLIIYFLIVEGLPKALSSIDVTVLDTVGSLFVIFCMGVLTGFLTHRMCELELKDYYAKQKLRMDKYYHKKK